MNYHFEDKGLEIKFSWKERLSLLFRGVIKLNHYSSYQYAAVLLKIVNTAVKKYGDGSKHGMIVETLKKNK
jgi:hypothetical protein